MIDELDLYFDDHDRGRSRHRRGARAPRRPVAADGRARRSAAGPSSPCSSPCCCSAAWPAAAYVGYTRSRAARAEGLRRRRHRRGADPGDQERHRHRHRQHAVPGRGGEERQRVRHGGRRQPQGQGHRAGYYKLQKQMRPAWRWRMLDPQERWPTRSPPRSPSRKGSLQDIYAKLAEVTKIPVRTSSTPRRTPCRWASRTGGSTARTASQ